MMWLALSACVAGGAKGGRAGDDAPVVTSTVYDDTSDKDGYVTVPVEVSEGVDVFQVVVQRGKGMLSTDYLYGPDGGTVLDWNDWYDSAYSLTDSFFPMADASAFNWPVRAQDGPLVPGTYEVKVATLNNSGYYTDGQDVQVEVLTRADADPHGGTLHAVIAYATGVRDEDGVVPAVESAVSYWQQIYAAAGVTVVPEYTDIAIDASMPDTYEGLDAYLDLVAASGDRVVLVVIGELIAGDNQLFGEAASIPGPYTATRHSAVEVSWLANAGGNGTFEDADIALMGETMAHEVGHYLGLFHPVEATYDYWDSLDDTEECSDWTTCDADLGTNLMYPYPVCTGMSMSTCERQSGLTADQTGSMNEYVGVE